MTDHTCTNALLLPRITADSNLEEVAAALAPIEACLQRGRNPLFDSGGFKRVDGPKLDRPERPRMKAVIGER